MLMVAFVVLLLIGPAYLAAAYYLGLVAARFTGLCDRAAPSEQIKLKITVIIPAHNEADQIADAVSSCLASDYPTDRLRVVVVADNCQDATASRATRAGACVLIRDRHDQAGKGPALSWAFHRLLPSDSDIFFVLDADCRLPRDTLRKVEGAVQAGHRVVQTNHRVTNPDESPISYAAGVGRTLEYDFFFAPKSRLGLSVLLVGTGMAFHRSVLETIPWMAGSCAEDTEYTIQLTRLRQPIRFLANASIECQGVTSLEALRIQRARWARGNIAQGHQLALGLILQGLAHRNLKLVDLGWTLLLVSRPLVLIHLTATVLGSFAYCAVDPTPTTRALASMAMALVPIYAVYFATGIFATGLNLQRLRHLVRAPLVVWQLGRIALTALLGMGSPTWVRTPRQ